MIWLVLPAYNEAENLGALLPRVRDTLSRTGPYQVLVVNDGSTDQTAIIATQARAQMPVRVVSHDRNEGLAQAIRTGLVEVSGIAADTDAIVVMDADNSHPPELIPTMVKDLEQGADIVIASRFRSGSRVVGVPVLRRMLSRSASVLFRLLFPLSGARDYTSGYRAYRASLVRRGLTVHGANLITAPGFSVMTELLLKLRPFHPRVQEVPLILRYDQKRGKSKMVPGSTIAEYVGLIQREWGRGGWRKDLTRDLHL